ncbi:hypothetical protein [Terriglobus roseus]|uniref:hypothetical protein n=1 Tax=Terriglobus roseus TaxID=392734 RepID=UPI001BB05FA9|nr:hypothetical protein [Terriglobus roseus]
MTGAWYLTGCGFGGVPLNGAPTTPTTSSDNWEIMVTPSNGVSANRLSMLSGSILSSPSGSSTQAPAVFQGVSSCFAAANVIPMDSTIASNVFQGRSFGVQGQYLSMTGNLNTAHDSMTGTYSIAGGCSDGESGAFTGTRYRALTGTYTGTVSQGGNTYTVSVTTTQGDATGVGSFLIGGTATFGGFSCFTTGTIPVGSGYISGSNLTLSVTSSNGAVIQMNGEIDPAATTVSSGNLVITGGACSGQYGPIKLTRQ